MNFTIDASVFVSAARPSEELYHMSYMFLQKAKGEVIFCPTLVLSECGAAIARPTGDALISRKLVSLVKNFPGMIQVPLSLSLAIRSAEIAIENRLRGADAVYVAVAEYFDAILISWDEEMLRRSPDLLLTMTPDQWLDKYLRNDKG
jgi:predicted nucleic acid-binding protein